MKSSYLICLAVVLIIAKFQAKNIEVPKIDTGREFDLKLGNTEYFAIPDFDFDYVYERRVQLVNNGTSKDFQPCKQYPAQLSFFLKDEVEFIGVPQSPPIIYQFEDIQYLQFLLDINFDLHENGSGDIYIVFENGMMAYIQLTSNKELGDSYAKKLQGFPTEHLRLSVGYFTKVESKLVFVNGDYAINVDKNGGEMIEGYKGNKGFETVITVEEQFIAVGFRELGVEIYRINENDQMELVTSIDQADFTPIFNGQNISLHITDLAYHSSKQILFVLDQQIGLIAFNLQKQGTKLSFSGISRPTSKKQCDIMSLNEQLQVIHMICDNTYAIYLQEYPKIKEKVLPHPKIKVHEIYSEGPLVAFIGRNMFKMMYLDRMVNFFEDGLVDRMIFKNNLFLSANENFLYIGTYNIEPPMIACQTQDTSYLGDNYLAFITRAECSKEFFDANNITKDKIGNYTEKDTCVYTVYQKLYLWEPAQIFLLPILIALIVFIVIGLTIIVIWIVKKIRLMREQKNLDDYFRLGSSNADIQASSGSQGYQKQQDEAEHEYEKQNKDQSKASNVEDDYEEEKPKQIEMGDPGAFDIQ